MGLEYYLFASYVFILLCIIIVICKYLFADVKRQQKLLDEKETKLLRTYQTLEDAMDEFYDLIDESRGDLEKKYKEYDDRLAAAALTKPAPAPSPEESAPKKQVKKNPYTPKNAPKSESDQLGFEQLFNEITAKTGAPLSAVHESILNLSKDGMSRAEIAKGLKITQNEVDLVIGMNKTSAIAK